MKIPQHRLARLVCLLGVLLMAVLALGACSESKQLPTPTTEPIRTPKPTFTPMPVDTDTPIPAATFTFTIEPTATETSLPTSTNTAVPPTLTNTVVPTDTPVAEPTVNPLLNPLTGLLVDDPAKLARRPVLVRYGNDAGARPHAGISQAEIVFEDIMEAYWITRLTAVFYATDPQAVGSLRSARPVNLDMVTMFDGAFVYSGASNGVNQLLAQTTFPKINEGTVGNGFYRSAKKKSPHNLYSSMSAIRTYLADSGNEKVVQLEGLLFSELGAAPPAGGQPAKTIYIPYPSTSTVDYTYDAASGRYMRYVQGDAYLDELTEKQVGVENVIVQFVAHDKTDIVEDSLGSTSINIVTIGEGKVQIFRDGTMYEGTWKRDSATAFPKFYDAQGNPIPLKPGHSWVQYVPPTYNLTIGAE